MSDSRTGSKLPYLAAVLQGEIECEAADTLGLGARRNLQALDDAGVALVLKARVLALGVFTDDGKVDVAVAGGESGERLAEHD